MCGSFCTHSRAMEALEQVKARFAHVVPIVSEYTAAADTRFGDAHDLMREMMRICDHRVISTIKEAEPIGPQKLLDLLIIAPCTGNTLGKLANGITDTSVTMAAKAHLRNGRPVLIAPSTNDAGPQVHLLRPLRPGRPRPQAHLSGGRLLPGGRRGSGRLGGAAAPAHAGHSMSFSPVRPISSRPDQAMARRRFSSASGPACLVLVIRSRTCPARIPLRRTGRPGGRRGTPPPGGSRRRWPRQRPPPGRRG